MLFRMTESKDLKERARQLFEDVVATGQVEKLDSLAKPDMFDHSAEAMGWAAGRAGFIQHIEWLHGSVSDIAVAIDDMIAEPDRVVVYWTLSGAHTGEFFGVPATNKTFAASAISLLTFTEGQLSEYMVRPDRLSLLQQLGVFPG